MSVQTSPASDPAATAPDPAAPTGSGPGGGIAGVPVIVDGELISSSPATGVEVGRFPVADATAVGEAVTRARAAATWWAGLGYEGRRQRLLRWKVLMVKRMDELLTLMHDEGGKPKADALIECVTAFDHIAWASRNAKRVLGSRRVGGSRMLPEFGARLEYQPFGVIGVIGPWNYPIFTPIGLDRLRAAAGNAVVFKPSEYTPAVGPLARRARSPRWSPSSRSLQVVYRSRRDRCRAVPGPASTRSRSPARPPPARR